MTLPPLLAGLTLRRIAWTAGLATLLAACLAPVFINTFLDLLVSALSVGFSIMLLVTMAGNLRMRRIPREALMLLAVVVGSWLGTFITSAIKGHNVVTMLAREEALWRVLTTVSLGIGFGGIIMAVFLFREQKARAALEAQRAEALWQRSERERVAAELAAMQAQVEPHFLFNTLATVRHLVETDPPRAGRTLDSLIAYLRAALPQMRQRATTVGREFALARAYLEVLEVRMGARLAYGLDLPPALADTPMPPMMLLSLVENAVKHGLEPLEEGGRIDLRATIRDGRLCVEVVDSGAGLAPLIKGGTGLTNIRERLATLHGADARLIVEAAQPRGTAARLELPLPATAA